MGKSVRGKPMTVRTVDAGDHVLACRTDRDVNRWVVLPAGTAPAAPSELGVGSASTSVDIPVEVARRLPANWIVRGKRRPLTHVSVLATAVLTPAAAFLGVTADVATSGFVNSTGLLAPSWFIAAPTVAAAVLPTVVGASAAARRLWLDRRPTETTTVRLSGWFGQAALELGTRCADLLSLADDIPTELGRGQVQRSAELAKLAGAGLLADAQQMSNAFDRYLNSVSSPDPEVVDRVAARLMELESAWRRTGSELESATTAVSALAEHTRADVARAELERSLDVSDASGVDVNAAVAAEMLAMVTTSVDASRQALDTLRGYSTVPAPLN